MNYKGLTAVLAAASMAAPAFAQEAAPVPAAPAAAESAAPDCELRVWPTENYIGINSGLLSGFGLVGALADVAVHEKKVKSVKDLMAEYLGPDVQMEELNKLDLVKTLKLAEYRVVIEAPTPFNEDMKDNPELKSKVKAMNAKSRRSSASPIRPANAMPS